MSTLIPLFATTRIAVGTLALLLPSQTLSIFRISPASSRPSGAAITTTRMFGVRDAVVGGLLLTASTRLGVQRALVAGMVVDAVDVCTCLYGVWNGDLEAIGGDLVGGGAVVFLGVAWFALWRGGLAGGLGVGKA